MSCDLAFCVLLSCCRKAIEQLCMFKRIEKRPMAWPCQLTIGSSLSIRIVGYKAVSWLLRALDEYIPRAYYIALLNAQFSLPGEQVLSSVVSENWTAYPQVIITLVWLIVFSLKSDQLVTPCGKKAAPSLQIVPDIFREELSKFTLLFIINIQMIAHQ